MIGAASRRRDKTWRHGGRSGAAGIPSCAIGWKTISKRRSNVLPIPTTEPQESKIYQPVRTIDRGDQAADAGGADLSQYGGLPETGAGAGDEDARKLD